MGLEAAVAVESVSEARAVQPLQGESMSSSCRLGLGLILGLGFILKLGVILGLGLGWLGFILGLGLGLGLGEQISDPGIELGDRVRVQLCPWG